MDKDNLAAEAKYRLLTAHYIAGDKWLPGDFENQNLGEEKGTIVGAGTDHLIEWPTLEMIPLNEAAEAMLEKERQRLERNAGSMNPVDMLPNGVADPYDSNYVAGTGARRRPAPPAGAPIR